MHTCQDATFLKTKPNNEPVLSLVVPTYNEEEAAPEFHKHVSRVLETLPLEANIVYVNDGSTDRTLLALRNLQRDDPRISIIDLSRNFGKEVALSAGLDYANGDAIIAMDADLQHPPELIRELVERWQKGSEIVFAVRRDRRTEGRFKRMTTKSFYRLLGWMARIPNHNRIGDFCLLDRCVVDVLKQMPERNRFMKGLFGWVGFKQDFIMYDPVPRNAGKTKWNYWRLWNFAIEGITSFSSIPLRVWTYVGFMLSLLCLLYATFIVVRTIVLGRDVPGYASLIVSILFMGGVQLISLGILGEYIGRIYNETKGRPLYIIKRLYGPDTSGVTGNPQRPNYEKRRIDGGANAEV